MPFLAGAQDVPPGSAVSDYFHGLQGDLETVYLSMIKNVNELTLIGRSLAALGALLYIAYRVWGHLARAEAIDFFPLLRPFALGLVLANYGLFVETINAVLRPTVAGTSALVQNTNASLNKLLSEDSPEWQSYMGMNGDGNGEQWDKYSSEGVPGLFAGITDAISFQVTKLYYKVRNTMRTILSEILQVVYEAAALCINTLRTFELLLLAILGPLVVGLSAFDGFRHVLVAWLSRYINVFLWLPVANIFGSLIGQVQIEMIKYDHSQAVVGGQVDSLPTDVAYIVFLILGIVGYFCVPSITNHIINVFPSGGGALQKKATDGAVNTAAATAKVAGAAIGA